jgi:hypothetical protein
MTRFLEVLPLVIGVSALLVSAVLCWIGLRLLRLFTVLGKESMERLLSIESRLAGIETALERRAQDSERTQLPKRM